MPESATADVRTRDKVQRLWHCIKWDPGSFLTLHDGPRPRLFHQEPTVSSFAQIARALTQFGRVLFRAARLVVRGAIRRRPLPPRPQRPFAVIVCVGTEKYRYEEQALADAIVLQGLVVVFVAPHRGIVRTGEHHAIVPEEDLRCVDIARASLRFIWQILSVAPRFLAAGDPLQRALTVEAITSVFGYFLYRAFFDRFARDFGLPQFVISSMPSGSMSRCLVSIMKRHGVPTAGIRTQTTSQSLEHLAINTEILFCKSKFEENVYLDLFGSFLWDGPHLEKGCVLSLPAPGADGAFHSAALVVDLPPEFVLVFGTAPSCRVGGQDELTVHHRKLLRVAKQFSIPVVYKPHPLDRKNKVEAIAREEGLDAFVLWHPGMGSNHALIFRSALVLSDVTTLVYGCIVTGKPVVILESRTTAQGEDEFRSSPIPRVKWGDELTSVPFSILDAYHTPENVAQWFDAEYFIPEDASSIVSRLKGIAERRRAPCSSDAARESIPPTAPRVTG